MINRELVGWLDTIHALDGEDCEKARAYEMNRFVEFLAKEHERFPLDEILLALADTGGAPSLIYDDMGHWTIGGDGSQNLPDTEEYETKTTIFQAHWYVPAGQWRKTPREALAAYLTAWGKEDDE